MYSTPHEVTGAMMAFPGDLGDLIPPYADIPEEFKKSSTHWAIKLQRKWFFEGIDEDDIPKTKEGIDSTKALRHLSCIQRSYEPKHEHKEAAVAYLFDRWFEAPK